MLKIKNTLTLASCFAALLGGAGVVQAQENIQESTEQGVPMSESAAEYVRPDSWFSLGFGVQDGSREQLGIFDGVQGSRSRGLFDADIKIRDDESGSWTKARIKNLGQDNRSVKIGFNKQGQWGFDLGYLSMPRVTPYTVYSSSQGLGTNSQVINTSAAAGSGPAVEIATQRDRSTFSLFKNVEDYLRFNFDFRHDKKSGSRTWGQRGYGSGGSYPEFLLEPTDWTIREVDTSVNYMGKRLQLTFGYIGSWFSNGNDLLNVTRETGTATDPYITLPLDNEAHKLHLSGGFNFTDNTRGAFKVSYNRALQNERMPMSDIASLTINADAPTNLDGRVDTTLVQLDLTSRPTSKLNVLARLRYLNEDDKTPAWSIVTGSVPIHSNPTSKETFSGKLEATYRLPDTTRITAGIEREVQDRDIAFGSDADGDGFDNERVVPFRTELDETTYKIQLRRNITDTASGSIYYTHADRDGSTYTDGDRLAGNTILQISPYYISDRKRNKVRVALDVRPIEFFGLQFSSEFVNDAHGKDDRPNGRDRARTQLYSIDADYAFNSDLLLTAWYSRQVDEIWLKTGLFGGNTNDNGATLTSTQSSEIDDTIDSFGLGIRNQVNETVKVGADLLMTNNKTSYKDVVPTITSKTTKVTAFAEYVGLGPGTLRIDIGHERWDTDDWTWEFSDGTPYAYATEGTTVVAKDVQTSNFVGVRYTTKF